MIDRLDGRFRVRLLELEQGGRLDAVEEHEGPVLFVRNGPLLAWRMVGHKIHQRQRIVGIGDGPGELPQRQAANAPMVELEEFAIDFHALLFVEH